MTGSAISPPRSMLGEESPAGEAVADRFCHAEVDDLGHGGSFFERDQDVRGLQVAVDDSLLVRVHRSELSAIWIRLSGSLGEGDVLESVRGIGGGNNGIGAEDATA